MRILKPSLMLLVTTILMLSISGCTPKTIYVDREVIVKVPVKCIVPNTPCDPRGNDGEVVVDLMECIIDLKKAQEVCR